MLKKIFLFFFCFFFSGCGFRTVNSFSSDTPPVFVLPIDGHMGQLLRSDLENRLSGAGQTASSEASYTLKVILNQAELGRQAIQKDATPTRIVISMTATYTLVRDGEEVLSNRSFFRTSANIVDNPFATHTSTRTAQERLVHLIAHDISTRLTSYFSAR